MAHWTDRIYVLDGEPMIRTNADPVSVDVTRVVGPLTASGAPLGACADELGCSVAALVAELRARCPDLDYAAEATEMARYTLIVDYEYNAEQWWDAAHELAARGESDTFSALMAALKKSDSVTCTREAAAEFESCAENLPGWNDGPRYAQHPVLIRAEADN